MSFDIYYHELVHKEDIPRLSLEWREKIKHAIENRLAARPEIYGKPLRQSLKGYRKLRVGNYRVVFRIKERTIKILIIQHRSVVYKMIQKRI